MAPTLESCLLPDAPPPPAPTSATSTAAAAAAKPPPPPPPTPLPLPLPCVCARVPPQVKEPETGAVVGSEQAAGCGGFGKGNFTELFKSIEDYERTLNV